MINKKNIVSLLASGALLLGSFTPALAETNLTVSGNGSASDNNVSVDISHTTSVVQNNTANVTNTVETHSNTGDNTANDNTGGSTTIDTGNATSLVRLDTAANVNQARLNDCGGCNGGDTKVTVSGNGSFSENNATVDTSSTKSAFQQNDATINNQVYTDNNTGYNDASRNTGGNTLVLTGHAVSDVGVRNRANANVLNMGGGSSGGSTGSPTVVRIEGNGSASQNDVNVQHDQSSTVVQDNRADFYNDVLTHNDTGYNNADDNTGGNTTVDTGNAVARTRVDNMANFNSASLDCGCMTGLTTKVAGNGSFSSNYLTFYGENNNSVFQGGENGNDARFSNNVDTGNDTGLNDSSRNTAAYANIFDPVRTFTGHSMSDTQVLNKSNMNVVGSMPSVNFSFDLNGLMSFMHNMF